MDTKKPGVGKYIAYGVGQAGDTIPYCMFYTFFVYFLTDTVGLPPIVAGAVSLIAVSRPHIPIKLSYSLQRKKKQGHI